MGRRGIPYVDESNLDAWGKCDKTGLPCMHRDLRRQMEYRGKSLVWTGLMVNQKDLDEPQAQLATPPIRPDPVPVKNPRHFFRPQCPSPPVLNKDEAGRPITVITATSVYLEWSPVEEATHYAVSWCLFGSALQKSTLPFPDPLLYPLYMTETSYLIEGLTPETAYVVRVASINNLEHQVTPIGGVELGWTYNMSGWSSGADSIYSVTLPVII